MQTRQKDPNSITVFFANVTRMSEKAKHKLITRGDDVLLVTETHLTAEENQALIKLMSTHGWNSTASAGRPTERSEEGTTAGSFAGIQNFHSNRPLTICKDELGKVTANAQLTGRMLILHKIEILTLAGYFVGGSVAQECNQKFLSDVDFITRGGRCPFICGIDGNKLKAEWDKIRWGSKRFLDHLDAEIVEVTNSNFTCRGGSSTEGGSMIDYFIISKVLIGLIHSVLVDFSTEWSPHYGIELKLIADACGCDEFGFDATFLP